MPRQRNKNNGDNKPLAKEVIKDNITLQQDDIRKQVSLDAHKEWYKEEYLKQWKFNKLSLIAKTKIDPENGSLKRINTISSLKYSFYYNIMDTIVVVFKLYDIQSRKETNYGSLFCEIYDNITAAKKQYIDPNAVVEHIAFLYYSAAPSFNSCDGEYRPRFSSYNTYLKCRQMFPDIWNDLENYINRIRVRREWSLYTSFYYPKMEQEARNMEVEYAVKSEALAATILAITWFHTIYEEYVGISKAHTNENFKEIFLGNGLKDDLEFMKSIIKKHGEERIDYFRAYLNTVIKNFRNQEQFINCGYKMIPLNIKEVQDPLKLRYKPWREFFISNRCNDLVINSICPSYSIILDWMYIKNARKGLFDNASQYNRMKHSELAKDILHTLYEAQRNTYFAVEGTEEVLKNASSIKQWISSKFKKLNEKIEDPINYSIEEIIMSEVTLAFVSEYVGVTFSDILSMIQKSKVFDSHLGHPFKDSGYDYFAKYMFEICYGLLCINSKLGVIHGDFHLNNATIGSLYYGNSEIVANKNKHNKVVYVLDDDLQLVFPNNTYFGCIIDFSRSILNPNMADIFNDKSLPPTYQLITNQEKFKASEVNSLLTLYIQLFPGKIKQKEELVVIFKNHFEAVFRLLTCIDLYMFTIRLNRMFVKVEIGVSKKVIELIEKLNRLAEYYITTEMNNLINEPEKYAKKIVDGEYPIFTIIRKCFGEYNDGAIYKDLGLITDIYCYNNNFKYSLDHYDTFPDFYKYAKYVDPETKKLVDIPKVEQVRRDMRLAVEKSKIKNLDMMNYIAMRHMKKIL